MRVEVDAAGYAALVAANSKLRDKLLELAHECAHCGGTGCATVAHDIVEPCGHCADIRAALE